MGFTIVELLIVIVVIAILAAISIVAYTGIQNQARATAATSAARQVADKIAVYAVENDGYPAALSDVGFSDSNGTTYQYRVDNGSSPATWCVTATVGNKSFYTSNMKGTPEEGACAGHGSGGTATVTNLVINPSFETGMTNCAVGAGGGVVTFGYTSNSPFAGVRSARATWTTGATSELNIQCRVDNVEAGRTYSATVSTRPSWSGSNMRLQFQWVTTSGSSVWNSSASTAAAPGQWNTRTYTNVAPANVQYVNVQASFQSGSRPTAGATLDADGFLLVEGTSVPSFADGSFPGWAWNGVPHNSTSTGPPL